MQQQPTQEQWARSLLGSVVAGRYKLESLLGMGGMGAVFAGVHVAIGRRVAVKLLAPETMESPDALERFQQEARAAAGVECRGVVDVLDFGVDGPRGAYLVMEHLRGESLTARLKREAPMEPRAAARLMAQVLETLAAVHRRGIVHRDLKPANLFVARSEQGDEIVKVLDFGISRMAPPPGRAALTLPGTVLGTPRYMSPEQAMGAPDVDARADLYSVGAVLYTALGGKKPYAECRVEEVLAAMCTRAPLPLQQVRPGLRESLGMVVDRAMARDRRERFQTADEMLGALREAVPEADFSWPATRPSVSSPSQPPPRPQGAVPSLSGVPLAPWLDPSGHSHSRPPAPASQPPPRSSYAPGTLHTAYAPGPGVYPPNVSPNMSSVAYAPTVAAGGARPAQGRGGLVGAAVGGAVIALLAAGGAAAWWWSSTGGTQASAAASGKPGGAGLAAVFARGPEESPTLRGMRARMEAAEAQAARGDAAGALAALRALRTEMEMLPGERDMAFLRVHGRVVIDQTSLRQGEMGAGIGQGADRGLGLAARAFSDLTGEYTAVLNVASRAGVWDVTQCAEVGLGTLDENYVRVIDAIVARGADNMSARIMVQQRPNYLNMAGQMFSSAASSPGEHDPRCDAEARAGLLRTQAARGR